MWSMFKGSGIIRTRDHKLELLRGFRCNHGYNDSCESAVFLHTACVCVCVSTARRKQYRREVLKAEMRIYVSVCACNSWVSSVLKNNWLIVLDQEFIIGLVHSADEAVIPRRHTFHLVTLTCSLYFHLASFELPSSVLSAVFFPGLWILTVQSLENSLIRFDEIRQTAFFSCIGPSVALNDIESFVLFGMCQNWKNRDRKWLLA